MLLGIIISTQYTYIYIIYLEYVYTYIYIYITSSEFSEFLVSSCHLTRLAGEFDHWSPISTWFSKVQCQRLQDRCRDSLGACFKSFREMELENMMLIKNTYLHDSRAKSPLWLDPHSSWLAKSLNPPKTAAKFPLVSPIRGGTLGWYPEPRVSGVVRRWKPSRGDSVGVWAAGDGKLQLGI